MFFFFANTKYTDVFDGRREFSFDTGQNRKIIYSFFLPIYQFATLTIGAVATLLDGVGLRYTLFILHSFTHMVQHWAGVPAANVRVG